MALSRLAREFAAEIKNHEWSDAPFRADRAGHNREHDRTATPVLTPTQTDSVKHNVVWVTAQVLGHADENFDVYEFAEACGLNIYTRSGHKNGGIRAGVRLTARGDTYCRPGTWDDSAELMTLAEASARLGVPVPTAPIA